MFVSHCFCCQRAALGTPRVSPPRVYHPQGHFCSPQPLWSPAGTHGKHHSGTTLLALLWPLWNAPVLWSTLDPIAVLLLSVVSKPCALERSLILPSHGGTIFFFLATLAVNARVWIKSWKIMHCAYIYSYLLFPGVPCDVCVLSDLTP